jgi:LysR family transcriptional regulator, low CO2-responsive transcriptional regulator
VTLTQLKVFVLVTRLGSVKAAANTLGVSEPAVSQALTALRQHLGDQLIVRDGATMVLTPAGQRVVGIASQMVSLAQDAEQAARASTNAPELLRVVAASSIADAIGPAVLQGFTSKALKVEVNLGVATAQEMTALLHERMADVALGPMPLSDTDGLSIQPLLRWRMVIVGSASEFPKRAEFDVSELATKTWLTDPAGRDPASVVARLLGRLRVPDENVLVFPNQDAALHAAARGEGIVPAVDHLLPSDLSSQGLARLPVRGTPVEDMWHALTITPERRSPMASRLLRFLSSPDALMAMHHAGSGVPAARFHPPIHVTLWS